jgi:hypothetical protein
MSYVSSKGVRRLDLSPRLRWSGERNERRKRNDLRPRHRVRSLCNDNARILVRLPESHIQSCRMCAESLLRLARMPCHSHYRILHTWACEPPMPEEVRSHNPTSHFGMTDLSGRWLARMLIARFQGRFADMLSEVSRGCLSSLPMFHRDSGKPKILEHKLVPERKAIVRQ